MINSAKLCLFAKSPISGLHLAVSSISFAPFSLLTRWRVCFIIEYCILFCGRCMVIHGLSNIEFFYPILASQGSALLYPGWSCPQTMKLNGVELYNYSEGRLIFHSCSYPPDGMSYRARLQLPVFFFRTSQSCLLVQTIRHLLPLITDYKGLFCSRI